MSRSKPPSKTAASNKKMPPQKPRPQSLPDAKAPRLKTDIKQRSGRIFAAAALAVLVLTSVFWAILSAHLQEANADQFIDAYLFESPAVFKEALFPGAHTFLLKWPLFAFMQLYGHSWVVFTGMTVLIVLATVGSIAYMLHKIEPRPWIFGVLCLALASVLLLVPAQPYPGALLPVNFAMTTTRNLEYVVFIASLYGLLKSTGVRHWLFWASAGAMTVLVASDKLFGVLALGGALFMLAVYAGLLRRRHDARLGLRALLLSVVSIMAANIILVAIDKAGITNVVNETNSSPFSFISSAGQLAQGLLYVAAAILTNFGANPVHDIIVVRELPAALLRSLIRPTTAAYALNMGLLAFGLYAAYKVLRSNVTDAPARLTVLLCGASLTALAVFVLTDHYYPVDARYVTIVFFALFVAAATFLRGRQGRLRTIAAVSVLIVLALPIGMARAWQEYRAGQGALGPDKTVHASAAETLDRNNIKRLVGDYWKITPVKAQASKNITISPVDNCKNRRQVLSSNAWFDLPKSTPTAYLAIRDPGLETYQGCTLASLVTTYGTPTERVALRQNAASPNSPDALLLLYSRGFKPLTENKPSVTKVLDEPAKEAPQPGPKVFAPLHASGACSRGTTTNIVAHQDDDILFMNPDLASDIAARRCVRTVYMTAGDAGAPESYWISREQGAKAAYAHMYGGPAITWRNERQLINGRFVTVSYLEAAPHIALVFMRLPDGNLRGQGFSQTGGLSLQSLYDGTTPELRTIDDQTLYTKNDLVQTLAAMLLADIPDKVQTQGSHDVHDGDHSDHHTAGLFAKAASEQYKQEHALATYLGYPEKSLPLNLTDDQITLKQLTFLAYAKFDGAVCQTTFECEQTATYGSYLTRQYKVTNAPPDLENQP